MTKPTNGIASKVAVVIIGVLMTACFGFAAQLHTAMSEHKEQSAKDALEIWKEIAIVKEAIAQMPKQVPPVWFVERVDKLEAKLDELDKKVDDLK